MGYFDGRTKCSSRKQLFVEMICFSRNFLLNGQVADVKIEQLTED